MNNGYRQQAVHPKHKHVALNNTHTQKQFGLHSPISAQKLGLLQNYSGTPA
jgi:hypothetical protein